MRAKIKKSQNKAFFYVKQTYNITNLNFMLLGSNSDEGFLSLKVLLKKLGILIAHKDIFLE